MQEGVHDGRVFDLGGEAELGLVEARFAPAVAFPIWVFPIPIASVVLGHLLGLAVSGRGRHRPFAHRFVDHCNRDCEVSILVVTIRDIHTSLFSGNFSVARNTDEARPSIRVGSVEGWQSGIVGRVSIEANRVDVVTESIVADDAVHAEFQTSQTLVEVGVSIPVTIVLLGLEVEPASNTRIRDHDVEERHTSGFLQVHAEGVIFVLEFDESVIKHIQREVSDVHQIGSRALHFDVAQVIASVFASVLLNEPRSVIKDSAIGSVFVGDTNPLVTGATDVVGAKELFMHVLRDASIGLFKLKDFFSREEAIEQGFNANPVRGHLFAEKLEGVGFGSRTLNHFWLAVARIRVAVSVIDFAEGSAGIIESTTEAESLLLSGVIQGPRFLVEASEVGAVRDEFLHIEVVEVFTAFAEEAVNFSTGIEI